MEISVAIFLNESLSCKIPNDLNKGSDAMECLSIEVDNKLRKISF